jgi:hypothetical protein
MPEAATGDEPCHLDFSEATDAVLNQLASPGIFVPLTLALIVFIT